VTATRSARHRVPGRLVVGGATVAVVATAALLIGLYAAQSEPTSDRLALTGPGLLVSWLLPLFALMSTLSTVGCAGALLAAVVLLRTDGGSLGQQGRRAIRDASNSAAAWAFAAFAGAVVTAAVLLSSPVTFLRFSIDEALGLPEVKALLITGILVTALAVGIRRANSSSAAGLGVLVAVAALIPPAVTAYPRNESYVVLAGAALVVHVIAATTWIGGLAGLVRYGRASRSGLPMVLTRFSQVALASSIILLVSGVVSAVARLAAAGGGFSGVLDRLTSDAYGGLLIAKTVLFIALIIGGWFHRYHTIGNLTDTSSGFWRLVGGELIVMAVAIGLSVALSQTT
jgi:putative copper export protein